MPSTPNDAMRVKRQELPRATARLVTSPRLQKSLAGAWFSATTAGRHRLRGDALLVRGRRHELAGADRRADLARKRADHAESGVVDPDRPDAGDRERLENLPDHVPARRDGDDVDLALAVLVRRVADDLPVEDRLVERHRDVVLSLEADGGLELVAVVDCGKAHRADRHPLVCDADADVARELLAGEELLDRLAERLRVGDLALAEDSGSERHDAAAHDLGRAVDAHFGRGDAAGLDVEADGGLYLLCGETSHVSWSGVIPCQHNRRHARDSLRAPP